jgi:hypothetical protein
VILHDVSGARERAAAAAAAAQRHEAHVMEEHGRRSTQNEKTDLKKERETAEDEKANKQTK